MEMSQIIPGITLLILLYALMELSRQNQELHKAHQPAVVYVDGPAVGPVWGQGPVWRGPRPGRWGWRHPRWRRRRWPRRRRFYY